MSAVFHHSCITCSNETLAPLGAEYSHAYLVRCMSCGLTFGKRVPTQAELAAHYNKYLRNNAISPVTIKRYEELLEQFEPYRKNNKILDVGCGDGHFLAVAKTKGWEVYGTEYTDEAVTVCLKKGITIHKGHIQEFTLAANFDVITSFEVLEHINDGIEHVAKISSLIRSGGLLYFTTPNFNALSRRVLGGKWKIIEYPEHLCYYTPSTLHALMKMSGLNKQLVLTTGCAMQKYYASTAEGQRKIASDENLRSSIESKWFLQLAKRGINGVLNVFRLGDTLKGYYLKP